MKIENNVATFNQAEVKIILAALKVQNFVKSNSAGDQKGLDTPGIAALNNLTQHIKKNTSIKLTDSRNFDSPNYAHELVKDLHYYMIYKDSLSLLSPKTKKACQRIQKQIKTNQTASK